VCVFCLLSGYAANQTVWLPLLCTHHHAVLYLIRLSLSQNKKYLLRQDGDLKKGIRSSSLTYLIAYVIELELR